MADEKETGGSAFPWFTPEGHYNGSVHEQGMNLRDYFAAKALEGILTNFFSCEGWNPNDYADEAYKMADAMLKARVK